MSAIPSVEEIESAIKIVADWANDGAYGISGRPSYVSCGHEMGVCNACDSDYEIGQRLDEELDQRQADWDDFITRMSKFAPKQPRWAFFCATKAELAENTVANALLHTAGHMAPLAEVSTKEVIDLWRSSQPRSKPEQTELEDWEKALLEATH